MKNLSRAEKKFENFKEWECFIVWNKNGQSHRKISAYYNRVNHFQSYLPTWSTNILSARNVLDFTWSASASKGAYGARQDRHCKEEGG